MEKKFFLPLALASLMLVGGGCAAPATTQDSETGQENDEVMMEDASATDESVMMGDDAMVVEKESDDVVMTEDGWTTYTNSAFNFSFDWPSRGKYAPMWEVTFLSADELTDGCYTAEGYTTNTVVVGDHSFCRALAPTSDDVTKVTDYYTTMIGEQPMTIAFTKDSAGIAEFSWDEHREFLNKIVGTYSIAE